MNRLFIPFLLLLAGCTPDTSRNYLRLPFQGPPEYAPPEMTLLEKANFFQQLLERDHLAPNGLLIYKRNLIYEAKVGFCYGSLSDTPIWGGCHLAAESFRYAVTKSPEALAAVRKSVKSLHLLQKIHGISGLLARHIAPKDDPIAAPRMGKEEWQKGVGEFADWIWRANVSKDQYSGMIFGYGAAYDLVDDEEIRKLIHRDMTAIADFLIKNDYRIIDYDGKRTKYHSMRARIGPIPIGVHALMSLAAIKIAHRVSGEERFEKEYRRLIRRRWPQATWLVKFQLFGKTNHNNDNMGFLSYYNILRLENDPKIRRHYEKSIKRTWKYIRHEGNSFWTFIHLANSGRDDSAREDARLQLRNFPASKRRIGVDSRGRTDIELGRYKNRSNVRKAKYPLPINQRARTSFDWKICPYGITSFLGSKGNIQSAPVDFLLAYWMGRYHGIIRESD